MTCSVRISTMLGYLSGGNGSSIRLRDLRGIVRILEWQVHLRQHKAIDVAAQERVSVGGHRDVEATARRLPITALWCRRWQGRDAAETPSARSPTDGAIERHTCRGRSEWQPSRL